MELLYEDETYLIIGAAMAVHQELGHGYFWKIRVNPRQSADYIFYAPKIPCKEA